MPAVRQKLHLSSCADFRGRLSESGEWQWFESAEQVGENVVFNGPPFDFTNWRDGEPNNPQGNASFLAIGADGAWSDVSDDYANAAGFVIEFSDMSSYVLWQTGFGLSYGNVQLNIVTGELTYNLDNSSPAVQALGAGELAQDTLTVNVHDTQGNFGSVDVTFEIQGVNDAPTSTDDSRTTFRDTSVVLTLADFGTYADLEGTAIAAVKITTLESDGSLEYDTTGAGVWAAVTDDQVVSATDIEAGRLRFVPAAGETGSPYATLGFQVGDGTAFSAGEYTLTVNVNSISNMLMNGLGGPSGFGESFLGPNDDSSSDEISITDVFGSDGIRFGNNTYTSLFVNNNGNVTFDGPLYNYSPVSFGSYSLNIIAPLWYDVYTYDGSVTPTPGGNSTGSNLVWWDHDTVNNIFTVTWDDVGNIGDRSRSSAFQLQMIDRGGEDFDFVFPV